jgi:hypothetical protein
MSVDVPLTSEEHWTWGEAAIVLWRDMVRRISEKHRTRAASTPHHPATGGVTAPNPCRLPRKRCSG